MVSQFLLQLFAVDSKVFTGVLRKSNYLLQRKCLIVFQQKCLNYAFVEDFLRIFVLGFLRH